MVTSNYTIKGRGLESKVTAFIRGYFASAYESNYKGGFVRVYDDDTMFNKTTKITFIRVDTNDAEEGIIRIEIISGNGSKESFISFLFGNKKGINEFAKALQNFCKEHFIEYTSE